jgi:hypothetical protein
LSHVNRSCNQNWIYEEITSVRLSNVSVNHTIKKDLQHIQHPLIYSAKAFFNHIGCANSFVDVRSDRGCSSEQLELLDPVGDQLTFGWPCEAKFIRILHQIN